MHGTIPDPYIIREAGQLVLRVFLSHCFSLVVLVCILVPLSNIEVRGYPSLGDIIIDIVEWLLMFLIS